MRNRSWLLFLPLIFNCTFSTMGAETDAVQCGVNEDRVWVYDSLVNFDVAIQLKCGEKVDVIGREKSYIKIRTASGKEGYVTEKTLPNVFTPAEDGATSNQDPQSAKRTAQTERPQNSLVSQSNIPVKEPVKIAPEPPVLTRTQPTNAISVREPSANTSNAVLRPSGAAENDGGLPSHSPGAALSQPKTAPPTIVASTSPANRSGRPAIARTGPAKPVAASAAGVSSAAAKTAAAPIPTADASRTIPAIGGDAPTTARAESANHAPAALRAVANTTATNATDSDDEDKDSYLARLEDNRACQIYFSAYGLSASQYKWLNQDRLKSFPGICPAPTTAFVDFVIIFTHDVPFYNVTLPSPVHTDKNGFSDFTPLTSVDTAIISPTDADKSRREYVWVFSTARGVFDPGKFSPKRRPLFTKSESNNLAGTRAASRTVEDALSFIQGRGLNR